MSLFEGYALFYDRLYAEKPYADEARFVHDMLQQNGAVGGRLLDVGCGTGRHACEFVLKGWEVTGLERSPEMLELALNRGAQLPEKHRKRLHFASGDLRHFQSPLRFDAITALFHVMSYQAHEGALGQALAVMADHLEPGGLLLFDFWHAPGVLADPPTKRIREINDSSYVGRRISIPDHHPEEKLVEVRITLEVTQRQTGSEFRVEETHLMRYFTVEELELALENAGFEPFSASRWLADGSPGSDDWTACILARRLRR